MCTLKQKFSEGGVGVCEEMRLQPISELFTTDEGWAQVCRQRVPDDGSSIMEAPLAELALVRGTSMSQRSAERRCARSEMPATGIVIVWSVNCSTTWLNCWCTTCSVSGYCQGAEPFLSSVVEVHFRWRWKSLESVLARSAKFGYYVNHSCSLSSYPCYPNAKYVIILWKCRYLRSSRVYRACCLVYQCVHYSVYTTVCTLCLSCTS